MLIDLCITAATIDSLSDSELLALELIGVARHRGRHIIIGDYPALFAASKILKLSMFARSAYSAAAARVSENRRLRGELWRLVVHRECETRMFDTHTEVSLSSLANTKISDGVNLLAENLSDARFYRELAGRLPSLRGLRGVCVYVESFGGGGSTTYSELCNRTSNGNWVVCVVDSDRDNSMAEPSLMARKCLIHADSCFHAKAVVLECRAIENLVPMDWIAETSVGAQSSDSIMKVKWLEGRGKNAIRKYADLKVVYRKCDTEKKISNAVKAELNDLEAAFPAKGCSGQCDRRSCIILAGFGKDLPEQLLACIGRLLNRFEGDWDDMPDLLAVLTPIVELGAAAPAIRI